MRTNDTTRQRIEIPLLIQTKIQRPQTANDLIGRPHLLERLQTGYRRSLTLISAPAGYGKTTLVSQWLNQTPGKTTWLSLDANDNNLIVFLNYFIAAIQTIFPTGCTTTQNLLAAPHTPSRDYLISTHS